MRPTAAWTLVPLLAVACFGGGKESDDDDDPADTGGAEEESDADTDADTDSDTDVDSSFTSYEGQERTELGFGMESPGTVACDLFWSASGTALDTCEGCEFVFEVNLALDTEGSTIDSTACGAWDESFVYTYMYAYNAYGYGVGRWFIAGEYYFYNYGYADFDGATFTYAYEGNYRDFLFEDTTGYYPQYDGTYMTYYRSGHAELQ